MEKALKVTRLISAIIYVVINCLIIYLVLSTKKYPGIMNKEDGIVLGLFLVFLIFIPILIHVIFFVLRNTKKYIVIILVAQIVTFILAPILGICGMFAMMEIPSYTENIKNYGKYDSNVDKILDMKQFDLMPNEITDQAELIKYYYEYRAVSDDQHLIINATFAYQDAQDIDEIISSVESNSENKVEVQYDRDEMWVKYAIDYEWK